MSPADALAVLRDQLDALARDGATPASRSAYATVLDLLDQLADQVDWFPAPAAPWRACCGARNALAVCIRPLDLFGR